MSKLIFAMFLLATGVGYIIPSIIAFARHHPQKLPIAALNIFGGWAGITWVVALIWALQNLDR